MLHHRQSCKHGCGAGAEMRHIILVEPELQGDAAPALAPTAQALNLIGGRDMQLTIYPMVTKTLLDIS
jgi:hypothetical protein